MIWSSQKSDDYQQQEKSRHPRRYFRPSHRASAAQLCLEDDQFVPDPPSRDYFVARIPLNCVEPPVGSQENRVHVSTNSLAVKVNHRSFFTRFDANQEDQIKLTVNKYLAEHGLAYEGKYHQFNGQWTLR